MELSYDEIRKIHRLEKSTSQLAQVSPEFYGELHVFLKAEKQKYFDSLKNFSVSKTRDFTNLKKMVEEIFSLRSKKILNKALIASRTNEPSEENMSFEEKRLYSKLHEMISQHNYFLHELFENENFSAKKEAGEPEEMQVKILGSVPSFVGYDMKEYGPFSEGEVIRLPMKIGKLLSSRKLGIVVEA